LHGLVRDAKGQKMSKSKGNVINPLEVVEKYGADALRMTLVICSTPGQDKSVSEQDFMAMRNFSNKIWNAARVIEMQKSPSTSENKDLSSLPQDASFIKKLNSIVSELTIQRKQRKSGLAADVLYNEFWH